MKSLQTLRDIVIDNFERSLSIPQLATMHSIMMSSMLKQPILSFEEGYRSFCQQIAESADTFDAWMVTIYDISAALGDFKKVVEELNTYNNNFKTSLNAGSQISYEFSEKDLPFVIAFAYRITLPMLTAAEPEKGKAA